MIKAEVILEKIGQEELGSTILTNNTTPFTGEVVAEVLRVNGESTHVGARFSEKDQSAYISRDPESFKGLVQKFIKIYSYDDPVNEDGDSEDEEVFIPSINIASANGKAVSNELLQYGLKEIDIDALGTLDQKRLRLTAEREKYLDSKLKELGTEEDLKLETEAQKIEKLKELVNK